jgi:tRNA pseudouridine38-40 synthase
MSRTFLATLHFDGTRFVGWQRQSAGRSVQAEFEQVLERLFGGRAPVHAAGRTDAGVHAVGLAVSFIVPPRPTGTNTNKRNGVPGESRWTFTALRRALNALLPADCWVEAVQPMRAGFHARKSALARRYRYVIGTDEACASPFRRAFEWALARPLDAAALRAAARLLEGTHDFRAFAAKGEPKPHYDCTIRTATWEPRLNGEGLTFHIEADRFLHHMVRMLVGTMVDVGLGRRPLADIERLLERRDTQETSPPAPPQGLYFVAATYPAHLYDQPAETSDAALQSA